MEKLSEILGNVPMTAEDFEKSLSEAGLVVLGAVDGGYTPSREAEKLLEAERRKFSEMRRETLVKGELQKCGAKNASIAALALNFGELPESDAEALETIRRSVARLKVSEPYMFHSSETVTTGALHGGAEPDFDMMDDSEYYKYRIK